MQINPVFATELCVSNDVVAIILDSSIPVAHGNSGDAPYAREGVATNEWEVHTSYGIIRGVSACLSDNHNQTVWTAYTANGGVLIDNGNIVVGGEDNGDWCWCRLSHPVVSKWVIRGRPSDWPTGSCYWRCADNCRYFFSSGTQDSGILMSSLYGSIDN